jgi:hypothetical protein
MAPLIFAPPPLGVSPVSSPGRGGAFTALCVLFSALCLLPSAFCFPSSVLCPPSSIVPVLFRRNVPVLFRRNVPVLFRERERVVCFAKKQPRAGSSCPQMDLTMKKLSKKMWGPGGVVCSSVVPRNKQLAEAWSRRLQAAIDRFGLTRARSFLPAATCRSGVKPLSTGLATLRSIPVGQVAHRPGAVPGERHIDAIRRRCKVFLFSTLLFTRYSFVL